MFLKGGLYPNAHYDFLGLMFSYVFLGLLVRKGSFYGRQVVEILGLLSYLVLPEPSLQVYELLTGLAILVFLTNLGLMELPVRFFCVISLFLRNRLPLEFLDWNSSQGVQLILGLPKTSFFTLQFSCLLLSYCFYINPFQSSVRGVQKCDTGLRWVNALTDPFIFNVVVYVSDTTGSSYTDLAY